MWKPSVCTKDCPDTCGLLAKVEDDKITKVKGDPDHPLTKGFICKKADYFPQHVHNEERILTPLIRSGFKGVNQLTSQRLTDQGETCAFHCNLVEVAPEYVILSDQGRCAEIIPCWKRVLN